ncbi:MAG: hypothetical protein E5X64_28410 [Mesorhizobium sp.]|nr:MAG: hypothetical protein E5X64_28410 [Mesorhizobium sp.]
MVELEVVDVGRGNSATEHRIAQALTEEAWHAFLGHTHEGGGLMFERNASYSDSGDAAVVPRLGILLRGVLSSLATCQSADHRRQNQKPQSHSKFPCPLRKQLDKIAKRSSEKASGLVF